MKKPLFSIITTCKNAEKTIEACIKSVLNQTYPYIEYIIQDGGSTDGTISILESYKGFIKVYSKGDRIADEGLLSCYSKCSGDWIGTCLSDEVLKSGDVEKMSGIINSDVKYLNSGAVYSNCEVINFFNKSIRRGIWRSSKNYSLESFLNRRLKIPLLATFFNKKVLVKCGIRFFGWSFDIAENEIFLRVSLVSDIKYIKSSVGSYFVDGSNLSIQPNAVYLQMKGLMSFLEKNLSYKCCIPLYYKKLSVYKSKQLLYLSKKFVETGSFKEAFDCFLVSLRYKVGIKDLFKITCLFAKHPELRSMLLREVSSAINPFKK